MTPRIGSVCTGYGGLDMAVQAVFGGELAWWADVEPGPIAVMQRHHPGVPNVHDIKTATVLYPHLPRVDILTAGYPCQPFSPAGLRLGTQDERHLWPYIAEAVGALRPGLVVLENVARHARVGFSEVTGDLAALGYDAVWTVVPASDVGAPHQRKRLFVLAANSTGSFGRGRGRGIGLEAGDSAGSGRSDAGRREPATHAASDGRDQRRPEPAGQLGRPDAAKRGASTTADALRERLEGHAQLDGERGHDPHGRVGADFGPCQTGDCQRDRDWRTLRNGQWIDYGPAVARWHDLTRCVPQPITTGQRGARVLSPAFVEWMMGLPAGHVTDVQGLSRNAMLKLLGNGVVPQQAEYALRQLVATAAAVDRLVAA